MSEQSLIEADPFQVADYRVEPAILRVTRNGSVARLEAKAMQVLVYLAAQAGRVVSREELEGRLWPGRIVTEDSVTNAISKLRRVFGDDARNPRVIETLPKTGYRLIAEVTPIAAADDAQVSSGLTAPPSDRRVRRWTASLIAAAGAVLLLVVAALWIQGREGSILNRTGSIAGRPAVAVLPFENLGPSAEQDYFAHGVTADLITDLSKLEGLLVIARGSASVFEATEADRREDPRWADVDYLILGSVQRQGDRVRINVQLIEASVERALWAERYDGPISDIFEIQDRLTAAVTGALKIEISPTERVRLAQRPTASVDAYDHYLRGLEEHGGRSEAQNRSARDHFERAIELDPAFTRAYAGLAMTHSRDAIDGWTSDPLRSLLMAEDLANRAARMDPSLPQVHFASGQIHLFRRRHKRAAKAAERAIEADPIYSDAHALLAWTLNYAGNPIDALSSLEEAIELSPRPPASYLEILGEILFSRGMYAEATNALQHVLDTNPSYTRARMWNTAAFAQAGQVERAEWEAAELLATSPDFTLSRLEFAFPFKDPRIRDSVIDGLRKAGLPEG